MPKQQAVGFWYRTIAELLAAAIKLADFLLLESPAGSLGKQGGKITAKRGPGYYRKIASMRKTHRWWSATE